MQIEAFSGFDKKTTAFFADLAANNSKVWFEEHRDDYERAVLEPARSFVVAMGRRLSEIAPDIQFDPKVNKSLFKLFRDTRFSKDKTPFKTHLGILWWEGGDKRLDVPSYYFHLEPGRMMFGSGLYVFPKDLLTPYREDATHPTLGPALAEAVDQVSVEPDIAIGGLHYKRPPRGFDKDHPNEKLLRHNGLYAMAEMKIPKQAYTPDLVEFAFGYYKRMLPIHRWLLDFVRRR